MSLNLIFFICKMGLLYQIFKNKDKITYEQFTESCAVIIHERKYDSSVSLCKWYD